MVIAHAGHWAVSLLYGVPVYLLVAALAWQSWRDRRRGTPPDDDSEPTLDEIMDGD
jgi:hypothetical protein